MRWGSRARRRARRARSARGGLSPAALRRAEARLLEAPRASFFCVLAKSRSFTTHQHVNGHTSTARSRRKSPRHRNLKGRKSDSQLYGHHMSRGSYDPMNCTASCFVVGPHLMMVLETFPLHLFPLGLTTTEKVRPALSRVLVILRLARRACLSCGSEASVPACASALARVSACARALSTTWRSEAKSRLVCLAQAVLGRDCSERLYPLPVRTILDRCQVGVRLALSQLLLFGHNRACRAGL